MAIRVPRNPDTRVSDRQLAYQNPAPGLDVSPITQAMDGLRRQLDEKRKDQQKFDLNRRLMDEVNTLQADFETRRRDPSISIDTFADSTNTAYRDRHQKLIDDLYAEGYDEDVLTDFDSRLATVRQGLFGNALQHQVQTLTTRAAGELDQYGISASQLAAANPNAWTSVEEDIRETVSLNPYLTEEQKIAKTEELIGIARQGGAKAYALQQPDEVIRLLDPQGFTAPPVVGATGGAVNTSGWQGVATTVADKLGLNATEVAAVMSFESAGTFDPTIKGGDGGNYMGLIQFGPNERAKYGIDESSTPEEWTDAILGFMNDRGFKKGMGLEDFYSTILTGGPGRYDARDSNGTSVRNAIPRILRDHRANAEKWLSSGVQTIDPGASTAEQAPALETLAAPTAETLVDVQTGVPILDALNGPERLQVLGWAREKMNQQSASEKAAMDVTIGNITAEAMQNGGEVATPIPSEADLLRVYGPVVGPQQIARIHQTVNTGKAIQAFRTQSASAIASSVAALEPVPGSPTYETELQIYDAAVRAQSSLLAERDADPAAYAMKYFPSVAEASQQGTAEYYAELDRVYETLGIDSRYAAVLPGPAMERVQQDYKVMTPVQRRQYIQNNFRAMGEDRFARFAAGMEGTTMQDDVRIYALMRNYGGQPGEWDNIYAQVLEGREIIAQDPARRPSSNALREQFRDAAFSAIGNLNAQASRAVQEAAAALYAQRGGDPKTIDQKLYRESLATALGGTIPVNMAKGQARDYTILPPKVSEARFESWIETLPQGKLTTMSVEGTPPLYGDLRTQVLLDDIVDQGVFVMTSPGRYMIKMASDGKPLMTATGKPFLVNIRSRDVVARPGAALSRPAPTTPVAGLGY